MSLKAKIILRLFNAFIYQMAKPAFGCKESIYRRINKKRPRNWDLEYGRLECLSDILFVYIFSQWSLNQTYDHTNYETNGEKLGDSQVTLLMDVPLFQFIAPFYPAKPKLRSLILWSEEFEDDTASQFSKTQVYRPPMYGGLLTLGDGRINYFKWNMKKGEQYFDSAEACFDWISCGNGIHLTVFYFFRCFKSLRQN